MALFNRNPNESKYPGGKKHFIDVLKNDAPVNQLVSLCPAEDFNTGTVLVVGEGEVALFVRDGAIVQEFSPGRYPLETNNYPFLSRITNSVSGGISSFNCKVWFVRTEDAAPIRWGTRTPIQIFDPELNMPADIRAFGSYTIRVADASTLFRRLVGSNTRAMDANWIKQQLEDAVAQEIITAVSGSLSASLDRGESLLDVCACAKEIAKQAEKPVADELESYGLRLVRLNIGGISIDPNGDYMHLVTERAAQHVAISERAREQSEAMAAFSGAQPNAAWQMQQNVDILGQIAQNPAGGLAGAAAGIGVGLGAMGAAGNMAGGLVQNMQAQSASIPQPVTAPVAGDSPSDMASGSPHPAAPSASAGRPTRFCHQCGTQIPASSKFCPECGAPQQPKKPTCPACGNPVDPATKFCPECGRALSAKA